MSQQLCCNMAPELQHKMKTDYGVENKKAKCISVRLKDILLWMGKHSYISDETDSVSSI